MRKELIFLLALWKANLLAAMEYRASFLFQVVGMALNNALYFMMWVIFFQRFGQVRGWQLPDMLLLFGVAAASWGIAAYCFGNATQLAAVVAGGKLDYYLALPRPVLLHVLASRSQASGLGDLVYGIISFLAAGLFTVDAVARYVLGVALATLICLAFLVLTQSIAFWVGNATLLASQAMNALLTFSLYPVRLFDGGARLLLYTVVPAAFVGAVPAELVRAFTWDRLALLVGAALVLTTLALVAFARGLRRYESGSAIAVQL